MTKIGTFYSWIVTGLNRFFSATAVVQAVQDGYDPKLVHLRALGIDPRAFSSVGHG